jgi:SAM-dependent methyltransferase
MMKLIRKLAPRALKRAVRRYQQRRARSRLFGALASLVPPVEDMFDGNADIEEFKANGEEFLRIYKTICHLRDDERILDVGSGIGRKTIPLTQYLTEAGSYDGIDINATGIEWCRRRITPRFPNFRFQQIDVANPLYNPGGACPPAEYRFPFADGSFTFVTLCSVFTHMMPRDVEHYLSEVSRVLGRGRCLISYFLLNDQSRRFIASGRSSLPFGAVQSGYATISPEMPERAVAFDEEFVIARYQSVGLRIVRIDRGSWCGREKFLSYQDLILAEKV